LREPEKFSGWLGRITTNMSRSYLRQKVEERERLRGVCASYPDQPPPTAEESAESEETATLVRKLLSDLPPDLRAVASLRYMESATYREMQAMLDLPISTLQKRLEKARRILRAGWKRTTRENRT
jgi:RNA polymerase sigma factor (sigma-70 family)